MTRAVRRSRTCTRRKLNSRLMIHDDFLWHENRQKLQRRRIFTTVEIPWNP